VLKSPELSTGLEHLLIKLGKVFSLLRAIKSNVRDIAGAFGRSSIAFNDGIKFDMYLRSWIAPRYQSIISLESSNQNCPFVWHTLPKYLLRKGMYLALSSFLYNIKIYQIFQIVDSNLIIFAKRGKEKCNVNFFAEAEIFATIFTLCVQTFRNQIFRIFAHLHLITLICKMQNFT